MRDATDGETAPSPSALHEADDFQRRRVFTELKRAREEDAMNGTSGSGDAIAHAVDTLGPTQRWLRAFKRYISEPSPRLILQPPQVDGPHAFGTVSEATMKRSIEWLLVSDRERLELVLHGVNERTDWSSIDRSCAYGCSLAQSLSRTLTWIIQLTGCTLEQSQWNWIEKHRPTVDIQFDARRDLQRPEVLRRIARLLVENAINHAVRVQVTPTTIESLCADVADLMAMGFEAIDVNFAHDRHWTKAQKHELAAALHSLGRLMRDAWADGATPQLLRPRWEPTPVRMDHELTVLTGGSIYASNVLVHSSRYLKKFAVGHIDDGSCFDRCWMDVPSNDYLTDWAYPPEFTVGNQKVGQIFMSFHKWMGANYGAWSPNTA